MSATDATMGNWRKRNSQQPAADAKRAPAIRVPVEETKTVTKARTSGERDASSGSECRGKSVGGVGDESGIRS
jgi:hypothetical protein